MTGPATTTLDLPAALPRVGAIRAIAAREVSAALRNRWFMLYAGCFAVLSLSLSFVAMAGSGYSGFAGFGRTAASVINLAMLIVPLMGLSVGSASIAGERDRGTLQGLLAQPIAPWELLVGKWAGLALALAAALAIGFGSTALVMGLRETSAGFWSYAAIFGFSLLLAWAMLGFGMLISTFAKGAAPAQGIAVFTWLTLVFLGDLGLMSGSVALRWTAGELLVASLANPLQVFKILAIDRIHSSLDLLGPAGMYASRTMGAYLPWILAGLLTAWIAVPLAVAARRVSRRGIA